jgi:hypothetical protein
MPVYDASNYDTSDCEAEHLRGLLAEVHDMLQEVFPMHAREGPEELGCCLVVLTGNDAWLNLPSRILLELEK